MQTITFDMASQNFKNVILKAMKLPAASGGVSKGIMSIISPHPNPLPRERELLETPPQAGGVF